MSAASAKRKQRRFLNAFIIFALNSIIIQTVSGKLILSILVILAHGFYSLNHLIKRVLLKCSNIVETEMIRLFL